MRVVSLLPSATETLCLVGGSTMLVGRSHECDFPPEIQNRPVLTSQTTDFTTSSQVDAAVREAMGAGDDLYRVDEARLASLKPDLILTQDLCEVCSIDLRTVQRLAASLDPRPEILSLNPTTFEGMLDDVLRVGEAVGLADRAEREVVALRERFYRAADHVTPYAQGPRVAFLEWTDPIYIGGHWTAQLVERAGASHPLNPTRAIEGAGSGVAAQLDQRIAGESVRITIDRLVESAPEAIVVCPCGLDLPATRREVGALVERAWWRSLPAVRSGRVALVDGNQMFNRPGPRLVDAYEWFVGWINDRPELFPHGFPWETL